MKKINEKTPNSTQKRASREQFYKKLSSQRKMLSQEIKDLRVLNTLKGGFEVDDDFELSEIDTIALNKHNRFMESESSTKINTIQSDIRLTSAIARGK
jgi:hypothetical protein